MLVLRRAAAPLAAASRRRVLSTAMAGATDFEKGAELLDRGKIGAAIEFFAKAGESGHADGNFFLGLGYDGLLGEDASGELPLDVDEAAAVRCYRRAAEAGHAEAMLNLSMSLRSGEGVAQADVGEAFRWLKSSAEAGSDRAQFNVGVALDPFHPPYGKPGEVDPAMAMIKKDPETAVEFYKMAAEQGHGKAMVNYGICLYEGNGCDKDKEAARQLWVEAMELGIDQASFCLKNMEEKKGEFKQMIED